MPGFDHHSVFEKTSADPNAKRNARYGLSLFLIYLILYGGFVILSAFAPLSMEAAPFGGVNLAVLYGLGLIGGAFVLALIYAWLCRSQPVSKEKEAGE